MKLKIFIIVITVVLIYTFTPKFIHGMIRINTKDSEVTFNRDMYELLVDNSFQNLNKSKIDSLYLWFHVRGLPIDEGHIDKMIITEWKELKDYFFYPEPHNLSDRFNK